MPYRSFQAHEWARKSLVGEYDMPRIAESVTLADKTMKAVRPQNGDTPAMFRESNSSKGLADLAVLNMGTTTGLLQSSTVYRATSSLVYPSVVIGERTLPADRFDVKVRISAENTSADIATKLADFRAFVGSEEFAQLIIGEAQF